MDKIWLDSRATFDNNKSKAYQGETNKIYAKNSCWQQLAAISLLLSDGRESNKAANGQLYINFIGKQLAFGIPWILHASLKAIDDVAVITLNAQPDNTDTFQSKYKNLFLF